MSPWDATVADEEVTITALPAHPDEDEGYSAMTKALSKDPFALYNQLKAHKGDLEKLLKASKARKDVRKVRDQRGNLARQWAWTAPKHVAVYCCPEP